EGARPPCPEPVEDDPEDAVGASQSRLRLGAQGDRELLAQRGVFEDQGRPRHHDGSPEGEADREKRRHRGRTLSCRNRGPRRAIRVFADYGRVHSLPQARPSAVIETLRRPRPIMGPSGEGDSGRRDARAARGQRPPRRRRGPVPPASTVDQLLDVLLELYALRDGHTPVRVSSQGADGIIDLVEPFDGGKRRALLDPVVGGAEEGLTQAGVKRDAARAWRREQTRLDALAGRGKGPDVKKELERLAGAYPNQVSAALYRSLADKLKTAGDVPGAIEILTAGGQRFP